MEGTAEESEVLALVPEKWDVVGSSVNLSPYIVNVMKITVKLPLTLHPSIKPGKLSINCLNLTNCGCFKSIL